MDAKTVEVINANLSEEDAAKVVAALEAAAVEDGVGTVLHNPATGDVALRVRQYGETYYRVVSQDDRAWVETQIAGWDVLHEAAAVVTTPGEAVVDPE
jgi:hypothetical protein